MYCSVIGYEQGSFLSTRTDCSVIGYKRGGFLIYIIPVRVNECVPDVVVIFFDLSAVRFVHWYVVYLKVRCQMNSPKLPKSAPRCQKIH